MISKSFTTIRKLSLCFAPFNPLILNLGSSTECSEIFLHNIFRSIQYVTSKVSWKFLDIVAMHLKRNALVAFCIYFLFNVSLHVLNFTIKMLFQSVDHRWSVTNIKGNKSQRKKKYIHMLITYGGWKYVYLFFMIYSRRRKITCRTQ